MPPVATALSTVDPISTSERVGRIVVICAFAAVALAGLLATPVRAAERPPVMGRNGGVSAGHPLTTAAAFEILARGGNAFDAGVAALLVGGVVEQDLYSLGGEALVLVYPRSTGKVVAVVGQGWAPEGATIDWYTARGRPSTARASIPRSCRARCMRPSRCWTSGAP